jgi:hypothetical protein
MSRQKVDVSKTSSKKDESKTRSRKHKFLDEFEDFEQDLKIKI